MALRRSPKPGALTASTFNMPRSLFSTRVASASRSEERRVGKECRDRWHSGSQKEMGDSVPQILRRGNAKLPRVKSPPSFAFHSIESPPLRSLSSTFAFAYFSVFVPKTAYEL